MSQKQVDNKQTKPIGNAVKKAIGAIVPTLACAAAILYISTVYSSDVALCASVNGNSVGYVRSTTTFSNSDAKLKATLGKATDGSYEADINVTYTLKHISDPEYISETEADEMLWSEVEEDFT